MQYQKWKKLDKKDQEELLKKEKKYQLQPEQINLGVRRPRLHAEQVTNQIL